MSKQPNDDLLSEQRLTAVVVLSMLAFIAGVLGTTILTFTLFGVQTSKEQYANAFIFTTTLSISTAIAALGFGKHVRAMVPASASVILAIVSIGNFISYARADGYEFYSENGQLGIYVMSMILALPLVILGLDQMQKAYYSRAKVYSAISVGVLILFGLLFVLPTHRNFSEQRQSDRQAREARSSAYKAEQAVEEAQQANIDKIGADLSTAGETVVNSVYTTTQAGNPLPQSLTPPNGYEFAEYVVVNKYKLRFCLKPIGQKYYLGVITDPFTGTTGHHHGSPFVGYSYVTDKCTYPQSYE